MPTWACNLHWRSAPDEVRMSTLDIRETNRAVRQLIEKTENPRHRYLLIAYDRHRNLEMAGRYEEIFAPDMTVDVPVYHFRTFEIDGVLRGTEAVKSLYRMWAATNQSVFYAEEEQVAVADNFVSSVVVAYHQMSGRSLLGARVLSHLPAFLARRAVERALAAKRFKPRLNSM